jgi:hypothetical protein
MNSKERAKKTVLSLEMALYHAGHDYPGGVEALAAIVGTSADLLRKKLNPNITTHNLNARDAQKVADLTQDHRILQSMCAIFGAGYFILPDIDGDEGALFERGAELMREVGELMDTVRTSLDDGRVDRDEVKALEKSLLEVMAVAKSLVETAKRVGGAGE